MNIADLMGGNVMDISDIPNAVTMDGIVVQLIDTIKSERHSLEQLASEMRALSNSTFYGARTSISALRLSSDIEEALVANARRHIEAFVKGAESYDQNVRGGLTKLDASTAAEMFINLGRQKQSSKEEQQKGKDEQQKIASAALHLKKQVIGCLNAWVVIAHTLNNYSHNGIIGIDQYSQYLKDRFIRPKRKETPMGLQVVMSTNSDKDKTAEYVKIKLLEDNPVLTDILLDFVEALPRGKESSGRSERGYSRYAIDTAVDMLVDLGNPLILDYIVEPQKRFADIADKMQRFFNFYTVFAGYAKRLYDLPHVDTTWIPHIEDVIIDRVYDGITIEDLRRNIAKISKADFEVVVQREEDYTPEDENERKTMEIRTKQMNTLYQAMKNIARISDERSVGSRLKIENDGENRKIAETALRRVLDDNVRLENLSRTPTARKMQRDLEGGNLYFVGAQGTGMLGGEFYWKRAPAPEATMDDVFGASFDEAKGQIGQIILTSRFPNLMRLTHHSGKPRNNIFLIGPPGCGKTTLAEAVCGSPNIIGASASVKDIETKWAGEKVNNLGRVYSGAEAIGEANGKPVMIVLDEFEAFFEEGGYDSGKAESVLLDVLQGVREYHGVMMMAMTNEPAQVPLRIMRRFQYVGIVGELTTNERAGLFKKFLETGLPVDTNVGDYYLAFAERLRDAPGDVVSKVVEKVHSIMLPQFISRQGDKAEIIEARLRKMELQGRPLVESRAYVKNALQQNGVIIYANDVGKALDHVLKNPAVVAEISTARRVYREAHQMMDAIAEGRTDDPFGARVVKGF